MVYGVVQFLSLQSWMEDSKWFGDDKGESTVSSFGQLMPLILLALPVLALAEQKFGRSFSFALLSKDFTQKYFLCSCWCLFQEGSLLMYAMLVDKSSSQKNDDDKRSTTSSYP